MKFHYRHLFLGLMVAFTLSACSAQTPKPMTSEEFIRQMRDSHVDGNVPEKKDFLSFLERDLQAHFADQFGSDCLVDYQFLRKGPTQSGVSLPKYYLWLKVSDSNKENQTEGAARVAAMDKKDFEVLQFFNKKSIQSKPEAMKMTFPAPLVPSIWKLAGVEGK